LIGMIYVVSIIVFSVNTPDNIVQNMVAALGAVTGVIGSMVAGYFGIQLGTAGRERAEAVREDARAAARENMDQNSGGDGALPGAGGNSTSSAPTDSGGGATENPGGPPDVEAVKAGLDRLPVDVRNELLDRYRLR
jgi:hypothetical protein